MAAALVTVCSWWVGRLLGATMINILEANSRI